MLQITGTLKKDGSWWVSDVPMLEIASQGTTPQNAVDMVIDAIQEIGVDIFNRRISLTTVKVNKTKFIIETNDVAAILSLSIRNSRENANLSIRKLASTVGTKGANTVAQYERGTHEPSLSKFLALLHAMGKDVVISVVEHQHKAS